jgi:hypothetical protein
MFVRWQKRQRRVRAFGRRTGPDTHWAAILVESVRAAGEPTQRHIAYLGGITESAIKLPAQRAFFWQKVVQRLDQLALGIYDRMCTEDALEDKVPRLTRKEYNGWLIHRAGLGLGLREPPSFSVCGVR